MEDLENAIYSLTSALEEHFTVDRSSLVTLGCQDNIHDTLVKLIERTQLFEELSTNVSALEAAVDELISEMKIIAKIQTRALKWQEMSQ